MKSFLIPICIVAFVAAARSQSPSPTPLVGPKLRVSSNYYSTIANDSAVIGQYFNITGSRSLGVGDNIYMSATNSIAAGYYNGYYSTINGDSALVVGSYNVYGSYMTLLRSAIIGQYNGSSNTTLTNSLVSGSYNSATVTDGFVAGKNNVVSGQHYVMGQGLIANTNPRMVVLGQYNVSPVAGQLLVVGNGASATAPKNALEIYSDGKVIIPERQGDILMGEFGN